MKRKIKFQGGGAVEEPTARSQQLRAMMEKRGREGRRGGLADRARERELANQEARRERARVQAEIERLNPGQGAAEVERRAGRAVPEMRPDFSTGPDGTTRRGAATGREVVPFREPGVPATRGAGEVGMPRSAGSQALTNAPRQIPLGPVSGAAARGASRLVPVLGTLASFEPTSLEEGARFESEGLRQARMEQMDRERAAMEQDMGEAGSRMPTSRPAPARRQAPARRELTADDLNRLAQGGEPRNAEEAMAQARMQVRRRELEGGAFKKGGMVKAKAAPKKMMKGGVVAKPKAAAAKAKPKAMSKSMPFKKGGMIKKGKK